MFVSDVGLVRVAMGIVKVGCRGWNHGRPWVHAPVLALSVDGSLIAVGLRLHLVLPHSIGRVRAPI